MEHEAPKSPHRRRMAEEINQGSLVHDEGGRQTSFETRMAMQRELDSARAELRTNERAMDELRRQAAASREEAALYRSDVTRLQGELKSCRERLNNALDGQQDLLSKNSHKQHLLVDMQAQVSSARDELGHEQSRNRSLETRVAQLEGELREAETQQSTSERTFDAKFSAINSELSVARDRLAALSLENDTLRSSCDSLRSDLSLANAALADSEAMNRALREEKVVVESRARTTGERAERLQGDLDATRRDLQAEIGSLRAQLSAAEAKVSQYKVNEESLFSRLESKDRFIGELQSEKSRIQTDLNQTAMEKDSERRNLQDELEASRRKERLLNDDLKQLHRYIGRRELNSTTVSTIAPVVNTTTYVPTLNTTTSYKTYTSPLETTTTTYVTRPSLSTSRRYTTTTSYNVGSSSSVPNPVLSASMTALNASRRAQRISQLSRERDDAEMRADLARSRLERSFHETY